MKLKAGIYGFAILLFFETCSWCMDAKSICQISFPTVVVISARNKQGELLSYGSGFHVGNNIVITNVHVIEGAVSASVRVINSKEDIQVSEIAAIDYQNDLVALKIAGTITATLPLETESKVSIGDDVYAVGNPRGLEGTFSKGMISALREVAGRKVLQLTAPISPGSSGGPILSDSGKAIGVAVSYIADGQNLNFAVPIVYVAALLKSASAPIPLESVRKASSRLTGDQIEPRGIPIPIGATSVSIGESSESSIAKLREYYKVSSFPDGSVYVAEKNGDHYSHLASIHMSQGKVAGITRVIGEYKGGEQVAIMKQLYSRLTNGRLANANAVVKCTMANIPNQPGNGLTRVYNIDLTFSDYSLIMTANDSDEPGYPGIFFLEEHFK